MWALGNGCLFQLALLPYRSLPKLPNPGNMSTSSVVRLDDYRGKRQQRLRQTLALYRPDPERSKLVQQLEDAAARVGADRAAVLWIDEYGPALVHSHCTLDLICDTPRTDFAGGPLRAAWEAGIPGLVDYPDLARGNAPVEGPRSMIAVALGSDGARAWFLAVDAVAPRPPLTEQVRGDLMFLAGECASIVLHRDAAGRSEAGRAGESSNRFAGWAVLRDIEGHEDDQELNRRIASRFLVARAVRAFVDDDFTVAPETLAYQIEGVRRELESLPAADAAEDAELQAWEWLLQALETGHLTELAGATLELAHRVEQQDHLSGALELYRTAYRVAVAAGAASVAVDAARFQGRVHRRLAEWDESIRWYDFARDVARSAGEPGREAVVLDGLASTLRDRGNLPGARELLHEALELGQQASDRYAVGSVHHTLAGIEKMTGHLDRAIEHGWSAVRVLEAGEAWLGALTDLASVFVEAAELQAAEDAYTIVAGASQRYIYRVYALDALAYVAALRGDRAEFELRAARADAAGWKEAAPAIRSEFSYFRGKSYQALGDGAEARRWYQAALRLAERHGLNKFYFDAEAGLRSLETAPATPRSQRGAVPETMPGIRQELSAMREAMAPVPA